MIGEITNESNSADAFALLHVPWVSGYAFGYVGSLETSQQFSVLIWCVQGSDWWMAGSPSEQFSDLVSCANVERSSVSTPMFDCGMLVSSGLLDTRIIS